MSFASSAWISRLAEAARGLLAAVAIAAGLNGCFGVDATLREDGSGTFEILYVPGGADWTVESETTRWTSPHVTVTSLRRREGGAVVTGAFDDATKLSSVPALRNLTVTELHRGDRTRLQVRLRNPDPRVVREDAADDPWLTFTLPGPVTWANGDGQVKGNRVEWVIPLVEWAKSRDLVLVVRWTTPRA